MRSLFAKLIIIFIFSCPLLVFADAGPPLYVISKGHHQIYILGSAHLLDQRDYPFNPTLLKIFSTSDILSVESYDGYFSERGFPVAKKLLALPGDLLTEDYVGTDLFKQGLSIIYPDLDRADRQILYLIRKSRPYFMTMLIESASPSPLNFSPAPGVETYLIQLAKKRGMDIAELEGMEHDTISYLGDLSKSDGMTMLRRAIEFHNSADLRKKAGLNLSEILNVYRTTGDVERLAELKRNACEELFHYPQKYCEYIMSSRNKFMANKIEQYFEDDKKHFVVVGAAHLGGENNILEILKHKGLRVTKMVLSNN